MISKYQAQICLTIFCRFWNFLDRVEMFRGPIGSVKRKWFVAFLLDVPRARNYLILFKKSIYSCLGSYFQFWLWRIHLLHGRFFDFYWFHVSQFVYAPRKLWWLLHRAGDLNIAAILAISTCLSEVFLSIEVFFKELQAKWPWRTGSDWLRTGAVD